MPPKKKLDRMRQVKRSLLYWAKGDKDRITALAIFFMLYKNSDGHRSYPNYSINTLAKVADCSWSTMEKYLPILMEFGLVDVDPNCNTTLQIKRPTSGTKHRNLPIDCVNFSKLRTSRDSVRHMLHLLYIEKMESIEVVIQVSNDPKVRLSKNTIDDFKKARGLCKRYNLRQLRNGKYEYNDFGKSYKEIAKDFGCSPRTAFRIIKDGVRQHLYIKHTHKEWVVLPCLDAWKYYYEECGFNFFVARDKNAPRYKKSDKNKNYKPSEGGNEEIVLFACKVSANTYTLSKKTKNWAEHKGDAVQIGMTLEQRIEYENKRDEAKSFFAQRAFERKMLEKEFDCDYCDATSRTAEPMVNPAPQLTGKI